MGGVMSTTQFYLNGRSISTANGYARHVKEYSEPVQEAAVVKDPSKADGVNLEGKSVAVTGANSGIGFEVTMK